MEQKQRKISPFTKVRIEFYKRVEEADKLNRQRIIASSLVALFLASLLLFSSALIETSGKGKYVYIYGDYEQSIDLSACFVDDVRLIDMNAIANYCGMSKEETGYVTTYKINGTYVYFENNNSVATVNGIKKEMPQNAQIKNGYCLIPISTANEILYGIEINEENKSATVTKTTENMYIFDKNPKIEYKTDVTKYIEYINSQDEYIKVLLNKQNPIDKDFEPENLVIIPEQYSRKDKSIYLHNTAMQALEAMLNDMAACGIDDIYVQSSYRSHSYQDMLFNMYIDSEMAKGLTLEEATENANKYSAQPGHSEHRTGLCVDFTTKSIGGAVDDVFETTSAFDWLKSNAWKYGFTLRYPEDKEHITGYIYESWHYRFVGLDVASVLYQTGLCYEEYLEIIK